MSEKQKEILEIIKTFIKKNGYSPTIREICKLANIKSTAAVHGHICCKCYSFKVYRG